MSDSKKDFKWVAVYDNGTTVSQSNIESYEKLPDKQRIMSFMILYENDVHEFIMCPEEDHYPVWFHRTVEMGNGRAYGMHVIAKLHVNTKVPHTIKFVMSNGQTFNTKRWWTEHAFFFEPEDLKPQEET